jgi:L-asparagine transporter-like permease
MAAMFGFFGIEIVAVAAAEARDPAHTISKAFKTTFFRLALFYLAAVALMLALVPWTEAGKGGSPFVIVMAATGIPYAAGVVNFLVLTAALSSMNGLLYVSSRMLFSLATAGQAPAALARVNKRGVPLNALLGSTAGIAVAAALVWIDPDHAFTTILAISTFMPLFAWGMVFLAHLRFRRVHGAPAGFRTWGFPWTSMTGAALVLAIFLTMPLVEAFRWTIPAGLATLAALSLAWLPIRNNSIPAEDDSG